MGQSGPGDDTGSIGGLVLADNSPGSIFLLFQLEGDTGKRGAGGVSLGQGYVTFGCAVLGVDMDIVQPLIVHGHGQGYQEGSLGGNDLVGSFRLNDQVQTQVQTGESGDTVAAGGLGGAGNCGAADVLNGVGAVALGVQLGGISHSGGDLCFGGIVGSAIVVCLKGSGINDLVGGECNAGQGSSAVGQRAGFQAGSVVTGGAIQLILVNGDGAGGGIGEGVGGHGSYAQSHNQDQQQCEKSGKRFHDSSSLSFVIRMDDFGVLPASVFAFGFAGEE